MASTPNGAVTGFVPAPASTEDRWAAEDLLCWSVSPKAEPWTPEALPPSHLRGGGYVGPTGPLGPGDGAAVVTPHGLTGAAKQQQASWRRLVETVQERLVDVLHLAFPGARTRWGLLARVAAKLAAFNPGGFLHRHFRRPDLALATLVT